MDGVEEMKDQEGGWGGASDVRTWSLYQDGGGEDERCVCTRKGKARSCLDERVDKMGSEG